MSLGTTDKAIRRVGVGNEITNAQYNGKDYIEIQLSLEPMGKGRTDPNVSSLVYDSGNLGYLTINSIKYPTKADKKEPNNTPILTPSKLFE